jgi:acetylornithine deacetylase
MELRACIERLIALPTISSVRAEFDQPNRPLIDFLANLLKADGFDVAIMPVSEDGQKANLLATLGKGPGGLVLAGHTDTVPYDASGWNTDPFAATERAGLLHGLGIADMKSFIALARAAMLRFRHRELKAPVILLATCDEESTMAGARALVKAGIPKARYAVIGEPTGNVPIRMHKGIAMDFLRFVGRSGHSSDPSLGVNALEGMRVALNVIAEFRDALQRDHVRPELHPPVPTMNLGSVRGGDNPNRICASCELQYDMRLLPGMDYDVVRGDLHKAIFSATSHMGLTLQTGTLEQIPSFETAATSAIVRAAEELSGHAASSVSFCTEAPFMTALGLEAVVWGPGDIRVAHQPNEALALADLEPTVDRLSQLIERICV